MPSTFHDAPLGRLRRTGWQRQPCPSWKPPTSRPSISSGNGRYEVPTGGHEPALVGLGSAMGTDFSAVRVHATGPLSEMTHAVGARALTFGTDITFAPGQWAPATRTGRALARA